MSLRRLRKLAGLNETIADVPEINSEIERRLDAVSDDLRTLVLDSLEVLKAAGPDGLSITDWATAVRDIHGEDTPVRDALITAVKEFPIVVKKLAPKLYAWVEIKSHEDAEFDPHLYNAIGSHVAQTSRAFKVMRELGSFTIEQLKAGLRNDGVESEFGENGFVNKLINHFSSMLVRNGNVYSIKDETVNTRDGNMDLLRDLSRKK